MDSLRFQVYIDIENTTNCFFFFYNLQQEDINLQNEIGILCPIISLIYYKVSVTAI